MYGITGILLPEKWWIKTTEISILKCFSQILGTILGHLKRLGDKFL
jgi:hypothetical protein